MPCGGMPWHAGDQIDMLKVLHLAMGVHRSISYMLHQPALRMRAPARLVVLNQLLIWCYRETSLDMPAISRYRVRCSCGDSPAHWSAVITTSRSRDCSNYNISSLCVGQSRLHIDSDACQGSMDLQLNICAVSILYQHGSGYRYSIDILTHVAAGSTLLT